MPPGRTTQTYSDDMVRVFVSVCLLVAVSSGARAQQKEPIAIVSLNSEVNPDGTFMYSYETANGIQAEARGQPAKAEGEEGPGQAIQGSFSFTADDGQQYSITYTADENGFQPQGAHLPTPPPIPEAIQRALEFIERNPQPDQGSNRVDRFAPAPAPAPVRRPSPSPAQPQRRPFARY